jgi:hypothetical protein
MKKELNDINQKIIEKNNENKELIDKYQEEAMNAKLKLANVNMESQEEIMKLKRLIKKLSTKLESMGVKVSDLK